MAQDFVKRPDREFEAQVAQFLANLGPVKTALGLPATWDAPLQTRQSPFTTTLNSLDLAELAERVVGQGDLVSGGVGDAAGRPGRVVGPGAGDGGGVNVRQ